MSPERGSDRPSCPRCGGRLHRERRRLIHRVVSVVYPLRYFACAHPCGWRGLLPHSAAVQRRKRLVHRAFLLLVLVLAVAGGWAVWRYRGELTWSPAPPTTEGEDVVQ